MLFYVQFLIKNKYKQFVLFRKSLQQTLPVTTVDFVHFIDTNLPKNEA